MSFDPGGEYIPPPIPIVDDNPEMDTIDPRNPASKRHVSSDDELSIQRSSSSSSQPLQKKGKSQSKEAPEPRREAAEPSSEQRLRLIIEQEVLRDYVFATEPPPEAKRTLVEFALKAVIHIAKREQKDVVISVMNEGFKKLEARIADLEKREESRTSKVEECVRSVDAKVTKIKDVQLPSAATRQYAEATKKMLGTEDAVDEIVKKANITEGNRFTVLELDEKITDDEGFITVKRRVASKFRGQKIGIDKVVRTKAGNLAFTYNNAAEQKKGEEIMKQIPRASIRSSTNKSVNLAIRGVPIELDPTEVKQQISDNNGEFFEKSKDWFITPASLNTRRTQRYRTFRLTVPQQIAARLIKEERMQLDLETVRVEIWSTGHSRCLNCFSDQHKINKPVQCTKVTCNTCAGNHKVNQCDKIDRPDLHKCIVCATAREPSRHKATVRDCPKLKQEAIKAMEIAARTLYG